MRRTRGRGFFTLAMVAGLLHAAPSLYWALGGTWLLETVGQFAVDLRAEGMASTTVLLLAITALAAGLRASQPRRVLPGSQAWPSPRARP